MRAVIVLTCLVAVAVVMQATEVFSKGHKKTAPKQAVKIRDGGCPQFGSLHIANRKRYTVQKCADWCNEVDGSERSGAVCTGFVMSKGRSKRCYLMKDGCTQGGNKKKFEYYQFYRAGFTLVGNKDCAGNYMSFIKESEKCHGWRVGMWTDVKDFCQQKCEDNEVPDGCPKTGKVCKYAIFSETMKHCYISEDPCQLTTDNDFYKAGTGHAVYTMYKKNGQPPTRKPVIKRREPTFYIVTNKDDPTLPKGAKCVSQQYAKQPWILNNQAGGVLDKFLWDAPYAPGGYKLCDGTLHGHIMAGYWISGPLDDKSGSYDGLLMFVEK